MSAKIKERKRDQALPSLDLLFSALSLFGSADYANKVGKLVLFHTNTIAFFYETARINFHWLIGQFCEPFTAAFLQPYFSLVLVQANLLPMTCNLNVYIDTDE